MADINDLKDICISSGTLRAEDLLPKFMGILKDYAPEKFNEFIKGYPELDGWEDFLEADWRIISDDTKMNASDDLFGLLNDIAPEGTMFSSTEGDGADFGFWTVKEKLLDDDEGEKALKKLQGSLSQYKGKSTGEVAADIRYDVATALDMAADKVEDLMFKFGLDNIYVLRAKGLSPKAIAKKILKADGGKSESKNNENLTDKEEHEWYRFWFDDVKKHIVPGKSGSVEHNCKMLPYSDVRQMWGVAAMAKELCDNFRRYLSYRGYTNSKGSPFAEISWRAEDAGDLLTAMNKADGTSIGKSEAALRPWRTDFEKDLQKRIDDAKGTKYDTKDFIADGWEFVTGDVYDAGSEYGSNGKDVAVAFFKREQDGQYYRMWLAFDPDTKEITGGKWWIESDESKDERRDSADYLQEVWDALVSAWDKEKFNMAKGYDDEYECEAITITVKDNEGVRAKIYVDDHEGKHPVGFNVIYRYSGDKGVGDLGYYEFQSTDFDETAPEIFAYFDELKGKIKAESKIDDSENILLFQTAKGSEANDAHDALEKLYLDNMDNTVDVVAIRMEDDGDDYYRVYATGKRSAVSKFLELYAQNFGKDAFTDSLDSMWTEPRDFKDLLITESKGDNWVAYYFCEDPQGLEWAVLPHAINGIGNARCVNSRGGNDGIAIEYVLDECTPIEDVKGSDIYGKVKELEDRDIVALTRDEAERIALADDRLKELKAIVSLKDESKNEDLNTAKDFVYSIAPIGILVRQASQPGFKDAKNSDNHIIVGFMRHDNTRFIIDWDADKKQGTATRQVMVDDKDSQYGYKWVTPKSNANVTFTTREELKDFVEGSWDNTSSESKKYEDFDMNKAFFQAKKAITDWTKRQGHKTLEWLYTDGRKSPTSYPSGIWDFEWDTGNGIATAELKVSPYETRTNSWNDSMDFSLKVGTEDKPTFYTSVEDVLYALDTLISKTEIKMESKKSESLTLKQKELKDMARYGEAEDITTISDAEAKELKKKGIETVGVSRGTYGMNGALLRDRDGNKYVITARSSNLFYFV